MKKMAEQESMASMQSAANLAWANGQTDDGAFTRRTTIKQGLSASTLSALLQTTDTNTTCRET